MSDKTGDTPFLHNCPAHGFTHTPVDLAETYDPPQTADVAQPQTRYAYNKDKQLTQILRPYGQQVEFLYNATNGKLETLPMAGIAAGGSICPPEQHRRATHRERPWLSKPFPSSF